MKIFTKTLVASLIFLSILSVKAQDNKLLKTFINKNDIALRSVQKNAINLADANNQVNFKELLKSQIASVKLFDANPEKSAAIAYSVRKQCTDFLSKNSQGPLTYLKFSDSETEFFSSITPIDKANPYLTKSELKLVKEVDDKNPNLFNDFVLRIK
jgi:replication initiation and membrane attachment protein DnaB